jgi:(E)-4-hydroxy-3-methylbut-2-enyl-diphosphate synthase
MIQRRKCRQVRVGSVVVGGEAPISVQSMTTTPTWDAAATVKQINELAALGCQIIRVAVPDHRSAAALGRIIREIDIPLVADVHFNHKLALEAIEQGIHGLRINPGNMRNKEGAREVARAALQRGIPIRVGVNSGSVVPRKGLQPGKAPTDLAKLMADEALASCCLLEDCGLRDVVVSVKASDCLTTMAAYRLVAARCDYPLHVGVTAAGTLYDALVKSALGIGSLLAEGIGDTVRVSITGPPHDEVRAGYAILSALGLVHAGTRIVSCPTCGRCSLDLQAIIEQVKQRMPEVAWGLPVGPDFVIAVMGCVVNGPGEASHADIGLAGTKAGGVLFRKGKKWKAVSREKLVDELVASARGMLARRKRRAPALQGQPCMAAPGTAQTHERNR